MSERHLDEGYQINDKTGPIRIQPRTFPVKDILVFFHGLTSHTGASRGFLEQLATHRPDALIVAIPLTGHTTEGLPNGGEQHRYDDYAQQTATFLDALHTEHPRLPIHVMGCSAGATMAAAIAERTEPDTLRSLHQLAPYYTPRGTVGQAILGLAHYVPPLQWGLNYKTHAITGDPRIEHFFPSTVGVCSALHEFAWTTWDRLPQLTEKPLGRFVYQTQADEVVSNPCGQLATERMGATRTEFPALNHNMTCHIRNTPQQLQALIHRISENIKTPTH